MTAILLLNRVMACACTRAVVFVCIVCTCTCIKSVLLHCTNIVFQVAET